MTFDQFVELLTILEKCHNKNDELLQTFRALDADGDGYISATDLFSTLSGQGEELSKQEAESMITMGDQDGDGRINYQGEFPVSGGGFLKVGGVTMPKWVELLRKSGRSLI